MEFYKQPGKIWLESPQGEKLAHILFPRQSEKTVVITSTYVSPVLRGQGIAGALMEELTKELRAAGQKAVPICSYAVHWFDEHPDQADLVEK